MEFFKYKEVNKDNFLSSKPFPNIELKDFWSDELLEKCFAEIKDYKNWDGEKNFFAAKKRLYSSNRKLFPENVKKVFDVLCSSKFTNWLESTTNEKELVADNDLTASGISSVGRGGYLKIHCDPNWNPKMKLYLRIIIIVYLNKNWKNDWGGHLELWDKEMNNCVKKVKPNFNNMFIFSNNGKNYHGHPDPLNIPNNERRNNLIMYYYSPYDNSIKKNNRTSIGELSDYKQRKVGEFGFGYYLNKLIKKIIK